jgi:ubiquinone/menaquinone biosynthesis C-methylase UbiE
LARTSQDFAITTPLGLCAPSCSVFFAENVLNIIDMKPVLYDKIGKGYSKHRRADYRIAGCLMDYLNITQNSIIADIGAGSGNYSNALADNGYFVKAIEPSDIMKNQSVKKDKVEWINGVSESIPLPDASVDAVVSIMASHHFTSLTKSLTEMNRICPEGPIIWFTFDPREAHKPWIADYFPEIWADAMRIFPPINELVSLFAKTTGKRASAHVFNLPHDLDDKFLAAFWREPAAYLNEEVRQAMSGFAIADPRQVESGVKKLKDDLADGCWIQHYGHVLNLDAIDWGYRFIVAGYAN